MPFDMLRESRDPKVTPELVFVAGAEYPKYEDDARADKKFHLVAGRLGPEADKAGHSHWRKKCEAIARHRLAAASYKVTLFDFTTGTREELVSGKWKVVHTFGAPKESDYRRRVDGSGSTKKLEPLSKTPIAAASRPVVRYYPRISEISADEAVDEADYVKKLGASDWRDAGLSIRHVYEHLAGVGTGSSPYSVEEVHLFGHAPHAGGWGHGPVFMNTDDLGLPGDTRRYRMFDDARRHPLDVDARGFDFHPDNFDVRAFRRAFALGASSFIWGCNWDRAPLGVAYLSRKVCKTAKPSTSITIDKAQGASRERIRNDFFREGLLVDEPKLLASEKYRKSWEEIAEGFRRLLRKSYMQSLADASARCAVGGVPGSYSEYDTKGTPLGSHIPMGEKYYVSAKELEKLAKKNEERKARGRSPDEIQDFRWLLSFYATCLGVDFHREGAHATYGRGFAVYSPDL